MSEATYREAFDYEPGRDLQGEVIAWIKAHANTEITREDNASMNCAIFTDLEDVCNLIGDIEKINSKRLYVALCVKGRNICYHEAKVNHGDVFTDIEYQVSKGKRAIDSPSKRAEAKRSIDIFNDVRSIKFNTDKQTRKIATDYSKMAGTKTSHLNLYWTLTGLEYIVANEPTYIELGKSALFEDALNPLRKANKILEERRNMLNAWMGI